MSYRVNMLRNILISSNSAYVGCIYSLLIYIGFLVTYVHGQSTGNIALHKPAYQQYTYTRVPYGPDEGKFDASNAVDGLKSDLSGHGGQCTLSANNKTTAIWWVNLKRIANIDHIVIYHRTDNLVWDSSNGYTSRFLGFSVHVSNSTSISDGTLCFKDKYFTKRTIPEVFNTTCHIYGQYVIFYNERLPGVVYPKDYSTFAHADICEFEVYECSIGYFGHNCAELCGHCIDPILCFPVDGTCSNGCSAGYVGRLCKTECACGYYGLHCNETCGHCSDTMHCSHVNGTCITGCKPGYEGERCLKECDIGYFGHNCAESCGHCIDQVQCSRVDGACPTGCSAGFSGRLCQKEDEKDWKSDFHGFVGAFCIALTLNGVLFAYILVKWIKRSTHGLSTDQGINVQKTRNSEHINEMFSDDLPETNKADIYKTV